MNRSTTVVVVAVMLAATASPVIAQPKPVIYPAKGQSTEQQQKDDGECYVWAKNATGVDPVALNAAPPPTVPPPKGQAAKGALRGAAGGALVGEVVDDNPGSGAAAGAVVGAARSAHKGKQAQAQQQSQAKAGQQQAMSTYYRGFGACMEGRGYVLSDRGFDAGCLRAVHQGSNDEKNSSALVLTAVLAINAAQAAAQTTDDPWKYSLQPYVWLPGVKANLRYGPPPAGGNSPNVTMDSEKLLNAIDMAAMVVGGVGYAFKWGDVALDYRALHYNVGGQKLIDDMTASGLSLGARFHF